MLAHATTVLLLKRSILTEKVARRGFHLTREYATDPLEILFVREVMRTKVVALPASATMEALQRHADSTSPRCTGSTFIPYWMARRGSKASSPASNYGSSRVRWTRGCLLGEVLQTPVVAHPDEPLRAVVFRMAETGFTRLPVVEGGRLVGMVSLHDLLKARVRNLDEERKRERVLQLRLPLKRRSSAISPKTLTDPKSRS